jgi:hypothetical protein
MQERQHQPRERQGPSQEFWGWLQTLGTLGAPLLFIAPWPVALAAFLLVLVLPLLVFLR